MSLTAKDVAEITRLLEESSFDELELEIDGMKLSLRRSGAGAVEAHDRALARRSGFSPTTTDPERERRPERRPITATAPATVSDPTLHAVAAPLLGTFYRAPKPGAPAFVEVGGTVEDDTIIGIIEVMKLMNTVRAGVRGTVEEILARDGTLVEYGDTLLRVRIC